MVLAFSLAEKTGPSPSASPCGWCLEVLGHLGSLGLDPPWFLSILLEVGILTWAPGVCRAALPVAGREGITSLTCSPLCGLPSLQWDVGSRLCWLLPQHLGPFQEGCYSASSPQPVLMHGVLLARVQSSALFLLEPDEVSFGPLLGFVTVCLCW